MLFFMTIQQRIFPHLTYEAYTRQAFQQIKRPPISGLLEICHISRFRAVGDPVMLDSILYLPVGFLLDEVLANEYMQMNIKSPVLNSLYANTYNIRCRIFLCRFHYKTPCI
jgi:hypothetical protein